MTKAPPKPTKLDFTQVGYHCFLKGSDKYVVDDHTMYVSEQFLMILVYKGNQITHNQQFQSPTHLKEKVQYFFLNLKKKINYAHTIKKHDIFVLHTNINSIHENQVNYYQVTKLIDEKTIQVHQLQDSRVMKKNNDSFQFYESIPLPNVFQGQSFDVDITLDTFTINDALAVVLKPTYLEITENVRIPVYPPQRFGLKSISGKENED